MDRNSFSSLLSPGAVSKDWPLRLFGQHLRTGPAWRRWSALQVAARGEGLQVCVPPLRAAPLTRWDRLQAVPCLALLPWSSGLLSFCSTAEPSLSHVHALPTLSLLAWNSRTPDELLLIFTTYGCPLSGAFSWPSCASPSPQLLPWRPLSVPHGVTVWTCAPPKSLSRSMRVWAGEFFRRTLWSLLWGTSLTRGGRL